MDKMVEIIVSTLNCQKAFVVDESESLLDKAKDIWSLGYIGGYSEALIKRKDSIEDAECFVILKIVYRLIFGEEHGLTYYWKTRDLYQDGDTILREGLKAGGEDVVAWISDNNNLPTGWSDHVLGYTAIT